MFFAGWMSRSVYLVMERDTLVAADLSGALQSYAPSRVITTRTPEAVDDLLHSFDRLDAAFVDIPVEEFLGSSLQTLLEQLDTRVIFTVGEDKADIVSEHGWHLLVRPFTDEMIRKVMGFGPSKS